MDIIQVERPRDNFIILETLSSGNQREEFNKSKVFFILNTENRSVLQLGRNTSCDVRIAEDISVSREHSLIKKIRVDAPLSTGEKGPRIEYWIIDNDSTFGTLVQMQYPTFVSTESLTTGSQLLLQSGKT